jgi:hypothetical protein
MGILFSRSCLSGPVPRRRLIALKEPFSTTETQVWIPTAKLKFGLLLPNSSLDSYCQTKVWTPTAKLKFGLQLPN